MSETEENAFLQHKCLLQEFIHYSTQAVACAHGSRIYQLKNKKIQQHQQQRTSRVIMSLANSLDNLTNKIRGCLADNTAMVYWQQHEETFRYLNMEDNTRFKGKLTNLRTQLRNGIITSVSVGHDLVIGGTILHTMEVKFSTSKCVPYMLLRQEGNVEHVDITPYFSQARIVGSMQSNTLTKTR